MQPRRKCDGTANDSRFFVIILADKVLMETAEKMSGVPRRLVFRVLQDSILSWLNFERILEFHRAVGREIEKEELLDDSGRERSGDLKYSFQSTNAMLSK